MGARGHADMLCDQRQKGIDTGAPQSVRAMKRFMKDRLAGRTGVPTPSVCARPSRGLKRARRGYVSEPKSTVGRSGLLRSSRQGSGGERPRKEER